MFNCSCQYESDINFEERFFNNLTSPRDCQILSVKFLSVMMLWKKIEKENISNKSECATESDEKDQCCIR